MDDLHYYNEKRCNQMVYLFKWYVSTPDVIQVHEPKQTKVWSLYKYWYFIILWRINVFKILQYILSGKCLENICFKYREYMFFVGQFRE
jgi:hypothetical protein